MAEKEDDWDIVSDSDGSTSDHSSSSGSSSGFASSRSGKEQEGSALAEYNALMGQLMPLPKAFLELRQSQKEEKQDAATKEMRQTVGISTAIGMELDANAGNLPAESLDLREEEQDSGKVMSKAEKQNAKKKRRKERERAAMAAEVAAQAVAAPQRETQDLVAGPSAGVTPGQVIPFKLFFGRPVAPVSLSAPKEEYPIPSNPRHASLPPSVMDRIRRVAGEAALDAPPLSLVSAKRIPRHARKMQVYRASVPSASLSPCATIQQPRKKYGVEEAVGMQFRACGVVSAKGQPVNSVIKLSEEPLWRRRKRRRKHGRVTLDPQSAS